MEKILKNFFHNNIHEILYEKKNYYLVLFLFLFFVEFI